MAAAHGAVDDDAPRCPACRSDPVARVEFGCDAPAPRPVFRMTCPRCMGATETCDRCGGVGSIDATRCPQSYMTPEINDALGAIPFTRQGVWPAAGGLLDQSASFVACVKLFEGEVATIQRREMERSDARRRADAAQSAARGRR